MVPGVAGCPDCLQSGAVGANLATFIDDLDAETAVELVPRFLRHAERAEAALHALHAADVIGVAVRQDDALQRIAGVALAQRALEQRKVLRNAMTGVEQQRALARTDLVGG